MPVRPTPMTYRCPACGWEKTVTPRSDALMPGDYYDTCPKCGNTQLETKTGKTDLEQILDIFKK